MLERSTVGPNVQRLGEEGATLGPRLATDGGVLAGREGEPQPSLSAALSVSGLTVSYGGAPVVFSVDATFPAGSMTAIVGPNGAGKSTLLKAALGIVKPLSGTVRFFGAELDRVRDRVAYVPQRTSVDWDFPTRVLDVVTMGLYRRVGLLGRLRQADRKLAAECLEQVGMAEFSDRQIGALSGGQQQRVFLARALAQNASLIILDEPFAGVDAATEKAIVGVLDMLKANGRTIIAVHHDLSTVASTFDRVLLINVRKVAEGPVGREFTPENLQTTYGGKLKLSALGAVATPALSGGG
ncbi:MAG: metal ABC transporter ATP-binding protein [Pseudomonadota bacterium]